MKLLKNDSERKNLSSGLALTLLFLVFFAFHGMAQDISSEDALEAQKNLEHKAFMSYVYMVVGFIVIIGIAWFSVVKKKNGENDFSEKPHPKVKYHPHSIYDKRYGTNHAK